MQSDIETLQVVKADLEADVDNLTENNTSLTKSIEKTKMEKSTAEESTETLTKLNSELKADLKKAFRVMSKMEATKAELDNQLALEQKSNQVLTDDITSLRDENTGLTKSVEELKKDKASVEEQNLEQKSELKLAMKVMSKMEATDNELENKLASELKSNQALLDNIASLQEENTKLADSIEELKYELKTASETMTTMKANEAELIQKSADVDRLVEHNTALMKSVDKLTEKVESVETKESKAMSSTQEENSELKMELKQVLKLLSKMEAKKVELDDKLTAEQKSNEVLQFDIISLREDNAELTESIAALKGDLKVANTAVEAMKASDDYLNSARAEDVYSLMEHNGKLSKSLEDLNEEMEGLKEEMASAQEMIACKTKEVEELSSDLKVATKVVVSLQSSEIDRKQQLEDETAKVKLLEEEKAALFESVEGMKREKATARETAEAQMERVTRMENDLKAATKLISKMQSADSKVTKDMIAQHEEKMKGVIARHEENVKTLTQELEDAKEELAEKQISEDQLNTQLGKVFIRVNDLMDLIDEKEETISILQETNQQLMSRRNPRRISGGSMRDPSEIMGEDADDVLKEKRMSYPKNLPRRNSRSFSKPPQSPSSRGRAMQFEEYEVEVDQEN